MRFFYILLLFKKTEKFINFRSINLKPLKQTFFERKNISNSSDWATKLITFSAVL